MVTGSRSGQNALAAISGDHCTVNIPAQYQTVNFSAQAQKYGVALPSIHLVPLNRSTQYDKKASRAFSAMYAAIQDRVLNLRKLRPGIFSLPSTA